MSSRKKFAGFLLVAVCLVGGELLSFSHPTEIACMQLQMDRLKKRTDRPRPLEEGGELFQPGPLRQTRGIQRCATGTASRALWMRCLHRSTQRRARGDARRGRGASRAGVVSSFVRRPDLRLVTFVPCSLVSASHRAWTYLHITRADRMPHPIIRSSQLSVSRTTCAHNRTRARSPPAL